VAERSEWSSQLRLAQAQEALGLDWPALLRYLLLAEQGCEVAQANAGFLLLRGRGAGGKAALHLAAQMLMRWAAAVCESKTAHRPGGGGGTSAVHLPATPPHCHPSSYCTDALLLVQASQPRNHCGGTGVALCSCTVLVLCMSVENTGCNTQLKTQQSWTGAFTVNGGGVSALNCCCKHTLAVASHTIGNPTMLLPLLLV
jgi:hypothetical protein